MVFSLLSKKLGKCILLLKPSRYYEIAVPFGLAMTPPFAIASDSHSLSAAKYVAITTFPKRKLKFAAIIFYYGTVP